MQGIDRSSSRLFADADHGQPPTKYDADILPGRKSHVQAQREQMS